MLLSDKERTALSRGVWYRTGYYGVRHSVCGLFRGAEAANAAGQVLCQHGVSHTNAEALRFDNSGNFSFYELTLPPVFGVSGLLSHNTVPVYESREEALAAFVVRFEPKKDAPGLGPAFL